MNIEIESVPVFTPIEGMVLGINEKSAARLQESTGFAKDVLPMPKKMFGMAYESAQGRHRTQLE